ncbi:MAG: hypothetical protein ABI658_31520 [Acidimicrobiales bacterium]
MTFCLAHPVPTIDLLPNRPCSDELVSRDPYPESGSPVLQVQPGAYAAFAPDPIIQDGNVPRKALYALAPRLEGWCRDSNPPCWQWNVIARLNGPPDVPPAVAPATIECTRSTGLPLTITDETGVVADCRSLDGASQFDPALVLNPDGNLSLLRVLFSASRCISGAEARFGGGPGAYSFVLTEGDVVQGCEGPPIGIGIDLGLRTDIAAAMVTATKASPPATALGRVTVTCDAPVVPGHCLQPLAWAVAHLPSGLAPVTSVSIMEINLCPSASPCVGQPHYYEWWAAFTLRDRAQLGMWVSNAFGTNTLKSADLGATPPPGAEPVSGSFTLNCGVGDDATCTGAAAASTDNSPNRPPDVVDVEQASGSPEHYLVNITFVDGTSTSVEVAPDPSADNGWSTVVLPSAVAEELEGWNVTCVDVGFVDCHGVAALFVNNLARSYGSVLAESGGQVTVVPRPQCPRVPSFIDATSCWQAIAPAADKDVCMVVGRDLPAVPPESRIFGFAQVGGDDMSGRAVPPQDWPPCV